MLAWLGPSTVPYPLSLPSHLLANMATPKNPADLYPPGLVPIALVRPGVNSTVQYNILGMLTFALLCWLLFSDTLSSQKRGQPEFWILCVSTDLAVLDMILSTILWTDQLYTRESLCCWFSHRAHSGKTGYVGEQRPSV